MAAAAGCFVDCRTAICEGVSTSFAAGVVGVVAAMAAPTTGLLGLRDIGVDGASAATAAFETDRTGSVEIPSKGGRDDADEACVAERRLVRDGDDGCCWTSTPAAGLLGVLLATGGDDNTGAAADVDADAEGC